MHFPQSCWKSPERAWFYGWSMTQCCVTSNLLHFRWDKGQNLKGQRTNDKVFFAYSKLNSTFLMKIFFQGSIMTSEISLKWTVI